MDNREARYKEYLDFIYKYSKYLGQKGEIKDSYTLSALAILGI